MRALLVFCGLLVVVGLLGLTALIWRNLMLRIKRHRDLERRSSQDR